MIKNIITSGVLITIIAYSSVVNSTTNLTQEKKMKEYKPLGIQSMVPYLSVTDIPAYLEFVQNAFGVEVLTETKDDDGVVFYATLKFDDTTFFVHEKEKGAVSIPSSLYLYVPDLNAAYQKAIDAGAVSIAEPAEQYHGDSLAVLTDKWGNHWFLAYSTVILNDDEVTDRRQKAGL